MTDLIEEYRESCRRATEARAAADRAELICRIYFAVAIPALVLMPWWWPS